MKRRTKIHFKQIHVSIPIRLLEDFDDTIDFHHSRSKKISLLISDYLNGDGALVRESSTRELLRAICNRKDTDDTLKVLLLQILAK